MVEYNVDSTQSTLNLMITIKGGLTAFDDPTTPDHSFCGSFPLAFGNNVDNIFVNEFKIDDNDNFYGCGRTKSTFLPSTQASDDNAFMFLMSQKGKLYWLFHTLATESSVINCETIESDSTFIYQGFNFVDAAGGINIGISQHKHSDGSLYWSMKLPMLPIAGV